MESPLVDMAGLLLPAQWIGLLAGACFIAAPAKFQAQSLGLPAAPDARHSRYAAWSHFACDLF